jgi:hypothetical protein
MAYLAPACRAFAVAAKAGEVLNAKAGKGGNVTRA